MDSERAAAHAARSTLPFASPRPQRALAALALASLLLQGCRKPAAEADKEPTPGPAAVEVSAVTERQIEYVVRAPGTLAVAQGSSARVAAVTAGRLLEVRPREGDSVRAGQIVARIDNRPLAAQARSAAAALRASETQARSGNMAARAAGADQRNAVRQATLALQSAKLDRDAALQQARVALASAETDQARLRAGARPQEIRQSEQAVAQAQATRDRAATEQERTKFLFAKGIASRRQLEDAQTALAVAEGALETARQQLSLLRSGARAEDLRAAELRVTGAKEALSQAEASGQARIAVAEGALRQAEQSALQVAVKREDAAALLAAARQKEADLAAASATARFADIRAPLSGVVVRRTLNPGDQADPSVPILEIADMRQMNLIASVAPGDGARVRTGMAVRVVPADTPARRAVGQVLSVGVVDPQSNLLPVRIAVPNPDGRMRAGAFATAEILVGAQRRARVVPKSAVVMKEGKSVVFLAGKDNKAHMREVTVGVEQGDVVEIRKGVAPGDEVIRLGQYALSDGAPLKRAGAEDKGEKKDEDKAEKSPGAAPKEGAQTEAPARTGASLLPAARGRESRT